MPVVWDVFSKGKLAGQLEAMTEQEVLARFTVCKGAKDKVTVEVHGRRR
jgi:hypothetical protein